MNYEPVPVPPQAFPRDARDVSGASTDEQLIALWLSGRPPHTVRAYSADVAKLRRHSRATLRETTAAGLIDWAETLARLKPASQYRALAAVKSLFSYAHKLGYIQLDPAAALRMPRAVDDRASKLLSAEQVQAVISAVSGRDRLVCLTLYVAGLRESELVALDTADLRQTATGYALTVKGKGSKLRTLAIPARLGEALQAPPGPLFHTERGNRLNPSDVYRIVRKAGEAASVDVTPHKLRHAHASHALDRGAPLHLVRDSLGHSSLATTSIYAHSKPTEGSALYIPMPPK